MRSSAEGCNVIEHASAVGPGQPLAAQLRDRHRRAHQLPRRRRAERDERVRLDQLDLALEPVQAGGGLLLRRRLVDAALAAQLELEVLDGIGDVDLSSRAMPSSASARSNSWPAGPTKGRPCRSSWSPGCSPTNISGARAGPSPGTACVACSPIGHSRQRSSGLAQRRQASAARRRRGVAAMAGRRLRLRCAAAPARLAWGRARSWSWLRSAACAASGWISCASGRFGQ